MAKLKPHIESDLIVGRYTGKDAAAVSRAIARHRKSPEYKKALPKIRRMEAKLRKRREEAVTATASRCDTDD